MFHTLRHDEALPRRKIDNTTFEIDEETAIDHVKEFIQLLMLMPVIFALDNPEPHDRVVYLAKRLVPPFIGTGIGELLNINNLQRLMQNIQKDFV